MDDYTTNLAGLRIDEAVGKQANGASFDADAARERQWALDQALRMATPGEPTARTIERAESYLKYVFGT